MEFHLIFTSNSISLSKYYKLHLSKYEYIKSELDNLKNIKQIIIMRKEARLLMSECNFTILKL